MESDSPQHRRKSTRLKGYDYSHAGAYFVTLCTHNKVCLFGEVSDGKMRLNDAGVMVGRWWAELNNKFPHIQTDESIIMPNHFHGIVFIVGTARCGRLPYKTGHPLRGALTGLATITDMGYSRRGGPGWPPQITVSDTDVPEPGTHAGVPLRGCTNHRQGHPLRGAPTEQIITSKAGHQQGGAPSLGDIMDWFKTMTTNAYIRGVKQHGWRPFSRRFWQRNYYDHVIRNEEDLNQKREYIINNPLKWELDSENPQNIQIQKI